MNMEYVDFDRLRQLATQGNNSEEFIKVLRTIVEQGDNDVKTIISTYSKLPQEIKELLYGLNNNTISTILKNNSEEDIDKDYMQNQIMLTNLYLKNKIK